jgi:GNAT superfamily N-acetyltransferase
VEAKVNAFLHANAASRLINERCGPFHIGFDPESDLIYLNYGVPESNAEPTDDDVALLVEAFKRRGRTPRLEFAPLGAPAVEPVLLAAGFTVEDRLPFMVCAPQDLTSMPMPDGVEVIALWDSATDEELYGVALAQHEAFSGEEIGTSELAGAAAGLRSALNRGGCVVLARGAAGSAEEGVPMGGGTFTAPRSGTTEVAGIAVRPSFRRRGVGAGVTALLTRTAFDRGLECVWLTPAGPDQERMYSTVGYRSTGEMLFISLV